MAKLAVFFLVIFVIVQLTLCEEQAEVGPDAETTSPVSLLDTIKKGIENGLSPENIDKLKNDFGSFTNSVTDLGNKFGENVKKFFDKAATTEAPTDA